MWSLGTHFYNRRHPGCENDKNLPCIAATDRMRPFHVESKLQGSAGCCRWDVNLSESETWEMQVVATSSIMEGEVALLTYGDHSNAHFLLHYGFA